MQEGYPQKDVKKTDSLAGDVGKGRGIMSKGQHTLDAADLKKSKMILGC